MQRWKAATLRRIVHALAWLPLGYWLLRAARGQLTYNPIQALTQRTGLAALTLLWLTLACTPLARWLGWRAVLGVRRTLGLYAFFYASVHLFLFVVVDYGLDLPLLWQEVLTQKPYVQVGLVTYVILAVLAVTSFPPWPARLGSRWRTLHRAVYGAAALALVHFAWVVKGRVTALQGNILGVLGYGAALAVLFLARLTWRQRRPRSAAVRSGVASKH